MIVVTVFLLILNQMEFHLVQNRNEYYHHGHIPFNVNGNGNIFFSVQPKPEVEANQASAVRTRKCPQVQVLSRLWPRWNMPFIHAYTQRNLFEFLLNQTEIRLYLPSSGWFGTRRTSFLVPNHSENGKYNLISVWFNKNSKRFLCVYQKLHQDT